jgi:hypothetical protein
MQVVVDPNMRFMDIELQEGGNNEISTLQDSEIFKKCEKGDWLNGSRLKVASDESEVGEYIIGNAGYPLLPWILTPYQEDNLSDSKMEFNRRHSAATTCSMKALARFQDTWMYLQREMGNSNTNMCIYACCILHNIVIEMEDDAVMLRTKVGTYCEEVRQIANEDAVRARDLLSLHFLTTKSSESEGELAQLFLHLKLLILLLIS